MGQEKAVPGGGWRHCASLSVYMAFPRCQLVIRSGPRSFESWLRLQLRHRQEDREVADEIWAPIFQEVPLCLPVLLES